MNTCRKIVSETLKKPHLSFIYILFILSFFGAKNNLYSKDLDVLYRVAQVNKQIQANTNPNNITNSTPQLNNTSNVPKAPNSANSASNISANTASLVAPSTNNSLPSNPLSNNVPSNTSSNGKLPVLSEVVTRVQNVYQGLESLSARFTQNVQHVGMSKLITESGTVEFKKGGKMRWNFFKPETRFFISDGKTLWIYMKEKQQVYVSTIQAGTSQTALNFLSGMGNIQQSFNVQAVPANAKVIPNHFALKLVPKENIGTISYLLAYVSLQTGLVTTTNLADALGTTTWVDFFDIKTNSKIDDSRFSFEVPKNANVIKQ